MSASSPLQASAPAARSNGYVKVEASHDSGPLSPQYSPVRPSISRKLSRESNGFGPSPESADGSLDDRGEGRLSVKRACNECRQQKVR